MLWSQPPETTHLNYSLDARFVVFFFNFWELDADEFLSVLHAQKVDD